MWRFPLLLLRVEFIDSHINKGQMGLKDLLALLQFIISVTNVKDLGRDNKSL